LFTTSIIDESKILFTIFFISRLELRHSIPFPSTAQISVSDASEIRPLPLRSNPPKFEITTGSGGSPSDAQKISPPDSSLRSAAAVDRTTMPPADDAPAPAPPPTPTPARGTAARSRVLLQSPPPAFPLGSNDDQLERARARAAARAASVRRRSLAATIAPSKDPRQDLLDREQVMDLFHKCIKLASENVRAVPLLPTLGRSLPLAKAVRFVHSWENPAEN